MKIVAAFGIASLAIACSPEESGRKSIEDGNDTNVLVDHNSIAVEASGDYSESSDESESAVQTVFDNIEISEFASALVAADAVGDEVAIAELLASQRVSPEWARDRTVLVDSLWSGLNGFDRNRLLAFRVARRFADFDEAWPIYITGFAYFTGSGVERDWDRALEWMNHPTLESNSAVMYRRALVYLDQEHGPYDRQRGEELMRQAAQYGHADAQAWLDENLR